MGCGALLLATLVAEVVSLAEQIDLPKVVPHVTQHRRPAVACPGCGTRVAAPVPEARVTRRSAGRPGRTGSQPQGPSVLRLKFMTKW